MAARAACDSPLHGKSSQEKRGLPGRQRPYWQAPVTVLEHYAKAPSIFVGVKLTRSPSCKTWSAATGWRLTRMR